MHDISGWVNFAHYCTKSKQQMREMVVVHLITICVDLDVYIYICGSDTKIHIIVELKEGKST